MSLPNALRAERAHAYSLGAWVAAALALVLAAACGDEPAAVQKVSDLRLSVVSGDSQVGPPFQELPSPLVVKLLDSKGKPVRTGQIVSFRVVEGGGSVFAGAAQSDKNGIAKEYWTLGGPGPQRLEARAVNSGGEKLVFGTFVAWAQVPFDARPAYLECYDHFTARWRSGGPCALDGGSAPANSALPVMFRVLNVDSVPLPNVLLRFALDTLVGDSMPQNGVVFPDATETDTSGVATAVWQLGSLAGTNHLIGFVANDPSIRTDFWMEGVTWGTPPDTLPPELVAFDITPDTVAIDSAVTFDLWFADDAGVSDALLRLLAPDASTSYCVATFAAGTSQNGQWTCSFVVPDSVQQLGSWLVEAVQVRGIGPDSLPGVPSLLLRMWTTSDLMSLGFVTSFVVVDGVSGVLDQQQLIYNGGTSARTLPGYSVWQSFTPSISGTLSEIDMGFFNDMSGSGELQILSGDGTAGPVLQTLTVSVLGITQPEVTWNAWVVNVPVTAGSRYTFKFTPNAATLPDPYGVAIGVGNPYPGGDMGVDDPSGSYRTDFDMVFRTFVR